jgi:peptidylprolyl isomerase
MYDNPIMNLTALLLLSALPAAAQTTATKPVVHHATHPATHTGACSADIPTLPASIPRIATCPKPLYTLRFVDTLVGSGPLAEPRKFYTVDYTGYLADGTVFDSSKDHGPITFPQGAGRVIPGFDTAFEGMHIGGKRRVFIPYELAYGPVGVPKRPDRPGNGIPPKSMLIFDLDLVSISDTPPKPPTPPAAPAGSTPTPAKPATPAAPAGTATPPPATPGSAQSVVGKPTVTAPASPTADPTKPTTTTAPPPPTTPQKP